MKLENKVAIVNGGSSGSWAEAACTASKFAIVGLTKKCWLSIC